jgi:ABC-type polysaccharide/polyol phosphate transport system ATPase subunit
MEVFIKAERVSLEVPLYLQHEREARNWRALFLGAAFDPPKRRLACLLDDVSFDIREGDRVALIGANGAGKSTLLKVLNGAYTPTSGRLLVNGRRQALLNMSLGFNGEATLRENIFLRGTAMGLETSYLRNQINSILAFAELTGKASHRLHTLSSGQRMRLGFAISTALQQDILLMDEWVGTGDANFMARATERLKNRVEGSKIVVLASHSLGLLREICNKGMVIEGGRMLYSGDVESAIKHYRGILGRRWACGSQPVDYAKDLAYGYVDELSAKGNGVLELTGWATSTTGAHPQHLALRLRGATYPPQSIARIKRPDVAKRFGLDDPGCGFRATFDIGTAEPIPDLADATVLTGMSAENLSTELRLSESVALALHAPSGGAELQA